VSVSNSGALSCPDKKLGEDDDSPRCYQSLLEWPKAGGEIRRGEESTELCWSESFDGGDWI